MMWHCVHKVTLFEVCLSCDKGEYTNDIKSLRAKDTARFEMFVKVYEQRLRVLNLYVTEAGQCLWGGSFTDWQRVQQVD